MQRGRVARIAGNELAGDAFRLVGPPALDGGHRAARGFIARRWGNISAPSNVRHLSSDRRWS
jgi:hypothetical protein